MFGKAFSKEQKQFREARKTSSHGYTLKSADFRRKKKVPHNVTKIEIFLYGNINILLQQYNILQPDV